MMKLAVVVLLLTLVQAQATERLAAASSFQDLDAKIQGTNLRHEPGTKLWSIVTLTRHPTPIPTREPTRPPTRNPTPPTRTPTDYPVVAGNAPPGYKLVSMNVAYCHFNHVLKEGIPEQPRNNSCCQFGWSSYRGKNLRAAGGAVEVCNNQPSCQYISSCCNENWNSLSQDCPVNKMNYGSYNVYKKKGYVLGSDGSNSCPTGYVPVVQSECLNAAKAAGNAAGRDVPANPTLNVGHWSHTPKGCFVHKRSTQNRISPHFNAVAYTNAHASNDGRYQTVCKTGNPGSGGHWG